MTAGTAPHHIDIAGSDSSMCWTYGLHFPGVSTKTASATLTPTLEALYRAFDPEVQRSVVGLQMHHIFSRQPSIYVTVNSSEEAEGFPVYRKLQRLLAPSLYYTTIHGVSMGEGRTCKVGFRIPGSMDDEGVENQLVMNASKMGFKVESRWPNFIIHVDGGAKGYGRLAAMFARHSVYLPPLTSEQELTLQDF